MENLILLSKALHYPNYYLSSKANNGFIIGNFNEINLNINFQKETMRQLFNKIQTKHVFNGQLPTHFQLSNLESVAEHCIIHNQNRVYIKPLIIF